MLRSLAQVVGNSVLPAADRFPILGGAIRATVQATYFHSEWRATRGKHGQRADRQSVLHLTINKSATQFVRRVLAAAAADSGLQHLNLSSYASWSESIPYLDVDTPEVREVVRAAFRPTGYLYSPFGGMVVGLENIEEYRIVLAVRDPRDVLTSEYFSTAHFHPLPGSSKRELLIQRRELALARDVDRYVLDRSRELLEKYESYRHLIGLPNVQILQYEQMITDFDGWLGRLLDHTLLRLSRESLSTLRSDAMQDGQGSTHKRRQKLPGDHLRKLRPATVRELNALFAEHLNLLGYPLDATNAYV